MKERIIHFADRYEKMSTQDRNLEYKSLYFQVPERDFETPNSLELDIDTLGEDERLIIEREKQLANAFGIFKTDAQLLYDYYEEKRVKNSELRNILIARQKLLLSYSDEITDIYKIKLYGKFKFYCISGLRPPLDDPERLKVACESMGIDLSPGSGGLFEKQSAKMLESKAYQLELQNALQYMNEAEKNTDMDYWRETAEFGAEGLELWRKAFIIRYNDEP